MELSGQDRKGHCHLVGYQALVPSECNLQKDRAVKHSVAPTPIIAIQDMSNGQHVSGRRTGF